MNNIKEIVLAGAPFVISGLTQFVKQTTLFDSISDTVHTVLLNMIVAALSLATAYLTYWQTGTLNGNAVQAFVVSVLIFFATSIPFWLGKRKTA